jgi:hypothetical protein
VAWSALDRADFAGFGRSAISCKISVAACRVRLACLIVKGGLPGNEPTLEDIERVRAKVRAINAAG